MSTVEMIRVLKVFDCLDMHVKLIRSDFPGIFLTAIDTHYIMQNENIVHVGNEKTIIQFGLSLEESV